jgi:hypothetical protein
VAVQYYSCTNKSLQMPMVTIVDRLISVCCNFAQNCMEWDEQSWQQLDAKDCKNEGNRFTFLTHS